MTETWCFPLTAQYGAIAVPMFVLDWGLALLLLFTLLLRFRQPDQPG